MPSKMLHQTDFRCSSMAKRKMTLFPGYGSTQLPQEHTVDMIRLNPFGVTSIFERLDNSIQLLTDL